MLSETARQAVEACGGADRWQRAQRLHAVVSVTGLAFVLKWRPYFEKARIEMHLDRQWCSITPIGKARDALTGVLDGDAVYLQDAQGLVKARREQPRRYFPGGRRLFWWDDLDMAYFANYAFWNYMTLPRLLLDPSIQWTETQPGRLIADFPASLHTHSPRQEFFFDRDTGLLRQHNYTAEIISKLATAANVVTAHGESNGYSCPIARTVTPMKADGTARSGPVLIDIVVHEFGVE